MLFNFSDSCTVSNGGCDPNAACSHDKDSNAVVCTCKTGYTNVGTDGTVVCKGEIIFYAYTLSNKHRLTH